MAQQIIPQGNGKYAVYCTISDEIIGYDASKDEVVEFFKKQAADKAEHKTNETFDKISKGIKPYYQFTIDWDDIKNTIKL